MLEKLWVKKIFCQGCIATSKSPLSYLSLSDHYEQRARLFPAVLSFLPLLPVAITFSAPLLEWKALLAELGLGVVLAVGLSHVASAFGNRLQDKLWPDWPHDSPTNLRLHPDTKSVSVQQKQRWHHAIKSLLHLDIQKAVDMADPGELQATINDAITELRSRMWKTPEGKRVQLHNVDYGFARNLTGLCPVWMTFALSSLAGCWYAYFCNNGAILWAIISTGITIGGLVMAIVLPAYVRKRALYYTESFYSALIALSSSDQRLP